MSKLLSVLWIRFCKFCNSKPNRKAGQEKEKINGNTPQGVDYELTKDGSQEKIQVVIFDEIGIVIERRMLTKSQLKSIDKSKYAVCCCTQKDGLSTIEFHPPIQKVDALPRHKIQDWYSLS